MYVFKAAVGLKGLRRLALGTAALLMATACGSGNNSLAPAVSDVPATSATSAAPATSNTSTTAVTPVVTSASGLRCVTGELEDIQYDYGDPNDDAAASPAAAVDAWWTAGDGRSRDRGEFTELIIDETTYGYAESSGDLVLILHVTQSGEARWQLDRAERCAGS